MQSANWSVTSIGLNEAPLGESAALHCLWSVRSVGRRTRVHRILLFRRCRGLRTWWARNLRGRSFGRTGSVLSSPVVLAAEPASQTTAAWLLPQVSEISVPWGTGTLSVKRTRKETLPIEASPPAAPQPALAETAELLRKTLVPGPATERLVDRVEEADVYQRAGLRRDEIYVCHHAKKMPRSEYWHVRIYVDAETAEILNKVEKVVYRLHPTFVQTERTQTNRSEQFALEITAWGEFMLYANVYFAGIARPIELKRYLNF